MTTKFLDTHFRKLDHIFMLVQNLSSTCEKWRQLGFSMTKIGYHNDALGTANHLAIFKSTYFELLGILKERPSNALYREFLHEGDAVRGIAFRPECDVEKIATHRLKAGLSGVEVAHYSRPLPEYGANAVAKFSSILNLAEPKQAGAMLFACQHHTPQFIWPDNTPSHENGALNISGLWILSNDPGHTADVYNGVFSPKMSSENAGHITYHLLGVDVHIIDKNKWADLFPFPTRHTINAMPVIAAIDFTVSDLCTPVDYFKRNHITYTLQNKRCSTQVTEPVGPILNFLKL